MPRPPKLPTEVPEWMQGSTAEVQALGMERRNLNVMVTHLDYLMLQEAAALEGNKTGENTTASDIVREVISQGLERINHRYDRGPEKLALSSLEHQVMVIAARDKVINRGE